MAIEGRARTLRVVLRHVSNMPALSAAVLCLVVAITDGDTIKVRCGEAPEEKVRLLQIDAPEKSQAFGTRAKEALSALIFGKSVELERGGQDRYGRTLARITLDNNDINFEMVREGYAWCYRKYLTEQGCLALEEGARSGRRGLWADAEPLPPWEFRQAAH